MPGVHDSCFLPGLRKALWFGLWLALLLLCWCGVARALDGLSSGERYPDASPEDWFRPTGIPELDAMLLAENPGPSEGMESFCSDDTATDCEEYLWTHDVWIEVKPVSARLLSVIKHVMASGAGGPPYHTHEMRLIWDKKAGTEVTFADLVARADCLSVRPGDAYPRQQEMYDLIKYFDESAGIADVFEPIPDGFALWVYYAGLTGPGRAEYDLSLLEMCGVREEYWGEPAGRE